MKYIQQISGIRVLAMIATVVAIGIWSSACTGDMTETPAPHDSGLPAHIRINWTLPDMRTATRVLTEEDERTVNTLWIGIYDYHSGKLKSQQFIEPKDDTPGHHVLQPTDILDVKTVSGLSRIVAVANADTNYGFSDDTSLCPVKGKLVLLEDLLSKADTWQKYLSICAARTDASQVDIVSRDMVMSGIYYETMDHPGDMDWTAVDKGVYIPAGQTELTGTIHLRRVDSKIRFEIVAGPNVSVEMTSWQVINTPVLCNLHEQSFNAGDRTTYLIDNRDGTDSNYGQSRLSQMFENSDEGYEFTFYQYENKRQGLERRDTGTADAPDYCGVESYSDREREYKDGQGRNTGIYKSLCATDDTPDIATATNLDNFATRVEIKAKVSYNTDENGNPVASGGTPRVGQATYTVHLGFCENKDDAAARARDFNCRRNTSYDYKITINSLSNIVVEAEKNGEPQSGAEGDVTDAIAQAIYLDSHYCVFNIHLTDEERRVLNWRINAPYDNTPQWYSRDDYPDGETPELRRDPFYNWVRFKPTSGENELAPYMKAGQSDSDLWTLEDLRDIAGHKSSPTGWYTIFIDEYSYLLDSNGNLLSEEQWQESDWMKYVNQQERTVWIDLRKVQVSDDNESSYSYSKYMISQYSMQSYYDKDVSSGTALALEHFNETWGRNLDWQWKTTNKELSNTNGRWNTWQYVIDGHTQWDDIIDNTTPDPYYPVPMLKKLTGRTDGWIGVKQNYNYNYNNNGYSYANDGYASHNPQDNNDFYEIISACMSRNRDLNGNGVIDRNELKWYLPAEGKYERMMLGRNALVSPLFDVNNKPYYTTPKDPYASKAAKWDGEISGGNSNQVHYASSDKMKFFPEEGGSYFIEELGTHWSFGSTFDNGRWPWNIRCMRNLGTNLSDEIQQNDPVQKAYVYTPYDPEQPAKGGIFDLSLYDNTCLRSPISTFLPVHTLSEFNRNLCPRQLRVSRTVSEHVIPYGSTLKDELNKNLPCAEYSEEADGSDTGYWRAPNQREMMMIINEKLYDTSEENATRYTCTMEAYGEKSRFAIASKRSGAWIMMLNNPPSSGSRFYVRCVRDIIDTRQQ